MLIFVLERDKDKIVKVNLINNVIWFMLGVVLRLFIAGNNQNYCLLFIKS